MASMTPRQTLSCLAQGISHLELILTAFLNSTTLARPLDLSLIPSGSQIFQDSPRAASFHRF